MTKKHRKDLMPKDVSRKELAKFWDTHSVVDYVDELKQINVKFAKNLSQGITIRLDSQTLEKIRLKAQKKGIGPTALICMWILERLKIPSGHTLRGAV